MSVVVAGEALIDLAPRNGLLAPLPGGSPYNVAVGTARLGCDTTYLGRLSRDGFGRLLASRLEAEGAVTGRCPLTDDPTTLAVVHLDEQARASYQFYLEGTSAIGLHDDEFGALPAGAVLHVSLGAVSLATEPAGRALASLLARERGTRLRSLDPNVRPVSIGDPEAYRRRLEAVVADCDVVKVSDEDLEYLAGEDDPLTLAEHWSRSGPALTVATRGDEGAVAWWPGGRVDVPGETVEGLVDTVGAGDAFTAGLMAWLDRHDVADAGAVSALDAGEVEAMLRQATRAAALTCARQGADPPRAVEL